MGVEQRDSARDWLLPQHARPPTIAALERRIDEALATAQASEAAAMTIGAAALDAAEQARRAANLAERASAALLAGGPEDDGLRGFTVRADRLVARLRDLERLPLVATG